MNFECDILYVVSEFSYVVYWNNILFYFVLQDAFASGYKIIRDSFITSNSREK
jgi:hypothetical protein